jgi:OmpA-OmpF porin, OOP family
MKKIVLALFILSCVALHTSAQNSPFVKKKSIGFSFIANDFSTPELLRTTSYSSVLRNDQFAKLKDMGHGFAVHYIQSALPNIDLAASFGGSFVEFSLPGKNNSSNRFLAEVDVSGNFKMFREAVFNPYLIAGIGASKYTNVYGAFVPLGGGVNIDLFGEAKIFTQLQYRLPVTTDANKHHFQVSFGIAGSL